MVSFMKKFLPRLWLLPLLFALFLYWPSLNGEPVFDDLTHLEKELPRFHSIQDVIFQKDIFSEQSAYYRPLIWLSFMASQNLGIGFKGFHLVNLLLHLFNVLLVFILVTHWMPNRKEKEVAALMTSLLFAVHPIHVEVTAWVAGVVEAWFTFFTLLSFISFIRYRVKAYQTRWLYLSLLTFFMALCSKETAILLLGFIPLYDWLNPGKLQFSKRKLTRPYLLYGGTFLLYMGLRSFNIPDTAVGSTLTSHSLSHIFLTGIRGMGFYLEKVFFPFPPNPYIVSLPNTTFQLIEGLLLMLTLFLFLWFFWRRYPLVTFHLILLIITLLPGAVVALGGISKIPLAERYLYLPSYFSSFLVVSFFMPWNLPHSKKIQLPLNLAKGAIFCALILFFSLEVSKRIPIFKNELNFWSYTAKQNPKAMVPYIELGRLYSKKGEYVKANSFFEKALSLDAPNQYTLAEAYLHLGNNYYRLQNLDQAKELYQKVIQLFPIPQAFFNLGIIEYDRSNYSEAITYFKKTLELDPRYTKASYYLGLTYKKIGRLEEAKRYLEEVIKSQDPHLVSKAKEALNQHGSTGSP